MTAPFAPAALRGSIRIARRRIVAQANAVAPIGVSMLEAALFVMLLAGDIFGQISRPRTGIVADANPADAEPAVDWGGRKRVLRRGAAARRGVPAKPSDSR